MFYQIFLFLICGNILALFTSIATINITSALLLLAIIFYMLKYPVYLGVLRQQFLNNKLIISALLALPLYIFIHQLFFSHSVVSAFKVLIEWRTLLYGLIFTIPFLLFPHLIKPVSKFFMLVGISFALIGLSYYLFTGKPFNQEIYKHAPYLCSQILVTAIFLVWQLALFNTKTKIKYLLYILGALASIMLFFATSRRTGYILYFFAFAGFILINLKTIFGVKSLKYKLIGLATIPLVLVGLYLSPTMHHRIEEASQEKQMYSHGNFETSNGLRLRFWNITSKIIQQSPVFGVGFSNYKSEFVKTETNFDGYNIKERFVHPHNEFMHVWSSFGIFAFLNYVFILLFPLLAYIKLNAKLNKNSNQTNFYAVSNYSIANKVLVIAFISSIVGTMFNAMAIDMIEGHFLSLILAIYYATYINNNKQN
ncbi:MAG: hypothetical protein RLZZ210_1570 [Pseudomonadota bacterium]|jgi:O-antigen ligase